MNLKSEQRRQLQKVNEKRMQLKSEIEAHEAEKMMPTMMTQRCLQAAEFSSSSASLHTALPAVADAPPLAVADKAPSAA